MVCLPGREDETLESGVYRFDYETDLSFENAPYSEDSTLRELMAQGAAMKYFEAKAPELAHNAFVRNFAGRLSIVEIKMTIPRTMVPETAYPIFEEMIRLLNEQARAGNLT